MNKSFFIGEKGVGDGYPPYIIAEMSANHSQSLASAIKIVEKAADAGVDAIKLQTYTADDMTLDVKTGKFLISDPTNPWKGQTLHALYQKAATPWEWHEELFKRAHSLGLHIFSSPFSAAAADFLEKLNVPAYKIASPECIDIPLLEQVAKKGKPIIISTGMANEMEIDEALQAVKDLGCKDTALLKCTSCYPTNPEDVNLLQISELKKRFDCVVGFSDHTLGISIALAAIAAGASIIEKHLTLDKRDGSVDSFFSATPDEFGELVRESNKVWTALGKKIYGPVPAEKGSLDYRRSLYVAKDVKKGEFFTPLNLRSIRPAGGVAPKHLKDFLNQVALREVKKGTPVSWDMIKSAP
ncbi:MAG TPA: pseudaminic acid synthase [Candidatus Omnitrophota bacterium]|nr:pseudaminic acid synthase [Candidatus Omnitrophota bacterium]